MFPLHLQTTKRALNPFNSLCFSFTSQSLKYLHEKTKSFDGEYIDDTTNKKLPEWDFPVVAVVGGKKEYVHGGEFYHFILLALTFSPFSPLPPLLPFTGNQDFSGHAQQRVTRLEFLRLSFPLPSASTSILVLQIKQLAYWPWGHFFFLLTISKLSADLNPGWNSKLCHS